MRGRTENNNQDNTRTEHKEAARGESCKAPHVRGKNDIQEVSGVEMFRSFNLSFNTSLILLLHIACLFDLAASPPTRLTAIYFKPCSFSVDEVGQRKRLEGKLIEKKSNLVLKKKLYIRLR